MDRTGQWNRRAWLLALAGAAVAPSWAQTDAKTCAVLLLHGQGASAQAMAGLARKLQPQCLARAPEMPWSAKRKEPGDALQEIARQVKELRLLGHKRILLAGLGLGGNAALAYAGQVGDIEGVAALSPQESGGALGPLPDAAEHVRQHVPVLWLVGAGDPLLGKGEAFAFAKAPPHPASRYVTLKSDLAAVTDAAAKPLLEWVKTLD